MGYIMKARFELNSIYHRDSLTISYSRASIANKVLSRVFVRVERLSVGVHEMPQCIEILLINLGEFRGH